MAEMVEHQATVETGLKMKIKRKNLATKSTEAKSKTAAPEDRNGNFKSRKSKPDSHEHSNDMVVSAPATDEKTLPTDIASVELEERTQKRKRNAKPVRQGKVQYGEDYEVTKGNSRAKLEPENLSKNQVTAATSKDKSKNGKVSTMEKPSRKRAATNSTAAMNINCEAAKPKNQRIAVPDKESVEDRTSELKKSASSVIKADAEEANRKADTKTHIPQDPENANSLNSTDPYEFVAKVEDTIQTPVKKFKSDKAEGAGGDVQSTASVGVNSHHDVGTEMCTIGVTTDPDCLGPCEPGTSVILEGIVWSESNNGILVVNVTWRGKTYVGTLMDTTKHHWASPRFREESPVPELDWRSPKSKRGSGTPVTEVLEGRRLRKCRRNIPPPSGGCTTSKAIGTLRQSPVQNNETNGNRRRGGRVLENAEAVSVCSASTQALKKTRQLTAENLSGVLLECDGLNCRKKFKHISGLNYHQSHAHRKSSQEESKCSGKLVQTATDDGSLEPVPPQIEAFGSEIGSGESEGVASSSSSVLHFDELEQGCPHQQDLRGTVDNTIISQDQADVVQLTQSGSLSSDTDKVTTERVSSEDVPLKTVENCALLPPVMETVGASKFPEDASESDRSVENGLELSLPLPLRQVPNKDSDPKEEVETAVASNKDFDKAGLPEVQACVPNTPFPPASKLTSSCHKLLPTSSRESEGKTVSHRQASEHHRRLPAAGSVTNKLLRNSSGTHSSNKSPTYSDICGASDAATLTDHDCTRLTTKDIDAKARQRISETKLHAIKREPGDNALSQSHPSSGDFINSLHRSSTASSSVVHLGSDSVWQQNSKVKDLDAGAKGGTGSALNGGFVKPATPEERRINSRLDFPNTEAPQAREHRLWLESMHPQHSSAMAASAALAASSSSSSDNVNMMPFGYGLDPAAYHMQFLSQNPETRSQYERWLMEQTHHYVQQQRCYNKLMQQPEADRCLASSDAKPVDMSSKGAVNHNDSGQGLHGKMKPPTSKAEGKPATESKSQMRLMEVDWLSSAKRRDSLSASVSEGVNDSCNDLRKLPTTCPEKGSKEKPDTTRQELRSRDSAKERGDRATVSKVSHVSRGSPDHSVSCVTPISLASNLVGNISPYSSSNPAGLLKNFIPDPRHSSLIGYGGGGVSYLDLPEGSSVSPNSKFLDLDSKQVVTGSNLCRPVGDTRHALDVLRYQSAMYGKPNQEQSGSSLSKHARASASKDFLEKESSHNKDSTSSPRENSESSGHSSPLTLRHLHTHHHTHVVGAAYPIYGSYNGLMSPVPAMVPSVPPVIPPTYLPK